MSEYLLIEVRLHDGRYHGSGEPEPSPGRLFQALVAGAARTPCDFAWRAALRWLESCSPPLLALPHFENRPTLTKFVPNNDLDTVDGDIRRLPELRVAKTETGQTFDQSVPFLYAWEYATEERSYAEQVCKIAERLYQFGRGIDLAYARGVCLDGNGLEERLRDHPGRVLYPGSLAGIEALRVPGPGTLDSLEARYKAFRARLQPVGEGRKRKLELRQPPVATFRSVSYGARTGLRVFSLIHDRTDEAAALPVVLAQALCVAVRDAAVGKLTAALPENAAVIDSALEGRRTGGGSDAPTSQSQRVRIFPLPSIGHEDADRRIRRIAVLLPDTTSLEEADVWWAFSGLKVSLGASELRLVSAWDDSMLAHYTHRNSPASTWRSVTPVALPKAAARRRIDPSRMKQEAKGGSERQKEEEAAEKAVLEALRHEGIRVPVVRLSVRRTAHDKRGERAERFATEERFKKERLWHVELQFARPVDGPLAIGDGRFMGLGLMAPRPHEGRHAFRITEGLTNGAGAEDVARALRRAVMARAQAILGESKELPTYFSGHARDGAKAQGHGHLRFVCDLPRHRILVFDHDGTDGFSSERQRHRDTLARALAGLRELRAGRSGLLTLQAIALNDSDDPLLAKARVWRSLTPFAVTRHTKRATTEESIRLSVLDECRRKGLPAPAVTVANARAVPGAGHLGDVTLMFPVGVVGPLLLGRSEHAGGGVFERV